MKTQRLIIVIIAYSVLMTGGSLFAQGKLDPVRLNSLTLGFNVGAGAQYFGNGIGAGPAFKGYFEKGMWDLGPGVITLGGEFDFSLFSHRFGNDWHEAWVNLFFAARGAYHYGWNVEGLDTYAGMPAGLGLSIHSFDDHPGAKGYQAVFPYFGFFMGASYFFNDTFGVNGEVGYNATHANIGIILRIK